MQPGPSPSPIMLHGPLTIERASALKEEIAEAIESQDRIFLDFSRLEDLDLACLQVLYAARLRALEAGKELHFQGSLPANISKRLAACGLLRVDSEHAEDFESALAVL